MTGFIQGESRSQATLFPERLDDYVPEESAVRVIDVFIDELDLSGLGFRTQPKDTGRPAYHPATMLKLFVYGYLNRVQSSRRLEREAQRNVELMWLTGRLAPDFKTIADFRKDNGTAIRLVCRQFVMVCRNLNLFANAWVAIDGSKFKAVNNTYRNFTRAKMKRRLAQVDETIERYLQQLAEADRQEPPEDKTQRLEDKIAALKKEMVRLREVEARRLKAPGQQISLTDPNARSMNHRGSGLVGYNVQAAVDTENHLIVAHEVTNVGSDRRQLARMAKQAKSDLDVEELSVVADRGYYRSEEIQACEEAGITAYVPKPQTSGNRAKGQFGRDAFRYVAEDDEYECPAGERLVWHMNAQDKGRTLRVYWTYKCRSCRIRAQCTSGVYRKMSRWEHEEVLDRAEVRLAANPEAMRARRATVEHPFGTLKAWMGSTHFLTKTLERVGLDRAELVRHVLISGQSGTGKSNLLKNFFYQAHEKGLHLISWDRKSDLEYTVRDGFDSIPWASYRLNPLCPPHPGVSPHEFRSDFAKLFSELFQFWARGHAIILQGVDQLYTEFGVYEHWADWQWHNRRFPTMYDLLDLFQTSRFARTVRGRGRDSLYSITEKLTSLLIELAPIVGCQRGFDLSRLHREQRVINFSISGLSHDYQNYLILTTLLHYAYLFKTTGPRGQLNVLFLFDEAKSTVGQQNKEFMVKDLVSKIRELGIGLAVADQIPSEIAQFLFSNIGTLIFFRHSDGNDLRRLQSSASGSADQMRINFELQPGEAIVRLTKSKDLHRITVPFEETDKFIPRDELHRIMAPRLAALSEDVIPAVPNDRPTAVVRSPELPRTVVELDNDERRFMAALAGDFERPQNNLFQELSIGSSTGHRIKKRLLRKKMISEVRTNLGKGGRAAIYLVPSPLALEELGIVLQRQGRGGTLHQYFQAELQRRCVEIGFEAVIEENRSGTGETPDLGLERDGKSVAIEICITSKPATEVANIAKNIRLGYDSVILSFVNSQLLSRTREIAKSTYPAQTL